MPKNLIPANKDPKYQIKESDRYYWHVLQTRITINPTNVRDQWKDAFVQIYDTANFNRLFRPEKLGGTQPNYLKAALIDEAVVIHNPELETDEPNEDEAAAKATKAPVQPAHTKRNPNSK